MKKIIIGLCGRSGSGKGYVSDAFTELGGLHLDTDRIYHELLKPKQNEMSECTKALLEAFGSEVIGEDLMPDRKRLSEKVFSDKARLEELNRITHKFILDEVMRILDKTSVRFAVIDAPVLFESGFDKLCDFTVCVVCSEDTCVSRIVRRDGISRERALKRLENQITAERLSELCDYTVVNDGNTDVKAHIENILNDMGVHYEL